MSLPPQPEAPPILWDVLEEHLDEAGWLWEARQESLVALDQSLEDVEAGEEARLLAHLDALLVGGAEVADELLVRALESDRPREVAAAAWALLAQADRDHTGLVLEALRGAGAPEREAIRSALALSARPGLDALLLEVLPAMPVAAQAALLEALALRGAEAGGALLALRPERDEALFAAALRAARAAGTAPAAGLLGAGLRERSPRVREAAIEAGAAMGRREVLHAVRRLLDGGEASRAACFVAAMGGDAADLERLARLAFAPGLRDEALWALGFSGRRMAAEVALRTLEEDAGRVAAEAFLMITGCELWAEAVVELDEADGAGADGGEEPPPDPSWLPGPAWPPAHVEVQALARWWAGHGAAFDPARRWWYGRAHSADLLRTALGQAPCRLRPALALELSARTLGAVRIDAGAFAAVQRGQLARWPGHRAVQVARPFAEVFQG